MKIVFVCNNEMKCGIADYSNYLLAELNKLVELEIVIIPSCFAKSSSLSHYLMNCLYAYFVARKIRLGDICHIQHEYALWGGVRPVGNVFPFFTAGIRMPVVMTLHELAPIYRAIDTRGQISTLLSIPLRSVADNYSDYLNRRMFISPHRLIVHTETQSHALLQRGVPSDRIICIPHGIPRMESMVFDSHVRQRFGLENKRYVVVVGFISQRKGYHLAIYALKLLSDDVIMVFAGGARTSEDHSYVAELRRFIALQGLEQRVIITDYLNMVSLKSLIKESLLVLAPFKKASGSGSLSIALSLGKAILASRLPEMEELAQRSKAIELFAPNDHVDLAVKLKNFLKHPFQITALEKCAASYAAQWSFQDVAVQTVMLYRQVLTSTDGELKKTATI